MPDIFVMLAFAKTDVAVKWVTQAKQSGKMISDDKKAKWEAKTSLTPTPFLLPIGSK